MSGQLKIEHSRVQSLNTVKWLILWTLLCWLDGAGMFNLGYWCRLNTSAIQDLVTKNVNTEEPISICGLELWTLTTVSKVFTANSVAKLYTNIRICTYLPNYNRENKLKDWVLIKYFLSKYPVSSGFMSNAYPVSSGNRPDSTYLTLTR